MRNSIITTSRPVGARVAPSVAADPAPPHASVRKRTFLGTAFLIEKAHRWGHRKLIVVIVATFLPLCLALAILVGAAWPFLAYGVQAPSTYQPTMLMVTGFFGAPGEHDASGLAHPTVLFLLYTDRKS